MDDIKNIKSGSSRQGLIFTSLLNIDSHYQSNLAETLTGWSRYDHMLFETTRTALPILRQMMLFFPPSTQLTLISLVTLLTNLPYLSMLFVFQVTPHMQKLFIMTHHKDHNAELNWFTNTVKLGQDQHLFLQHGLYEDVYAVNMAMLIQVTCGGTTCSSKCGTLTLH